MNTWFKPITILRYTPTAITAIAISAEYYNDKNNVIVSTNSPNNFRT